MKFAVLEKDCCSGEEGRNNKTVFTASFLELCCKRVRRHAFMDGDSPSYSVSLILGDTEFDLKNCNPKRSNSSRW